MKRVQVVQEDGGHNNETRDNKGEKTDKISFIRPEELAGFGSCFPPYPHSERFRNKESKAEPDLLIFKFQFSRILLACVLS